MGLNGGYKMSELENKGAENLTEVQETRKGKEEREKPKLRKRKRSRRERPLWLAAHRRRKEENRLDYCAGSRGSHCRLFRSDQRNCQEYAHAGEYH